MRINTRLIIQMASVCCQLKFVNMKVLIVIAFLVVAVQAGHFFDRNDPKFKETAAECAKETGADISGFESLKDGEKPSKEMLDKPEIKCFHKCMLVKGGLISDSGEPNLDKIKEKFKLNDDMVNQIKECATSATSSDPCEKVSEIHKCAMEKMKHQS